jgi:hypothetical protein
MEKNKINIYSDDDDNEPLTREKTLMQKIVDEDLWNQWRSQRGVDHVNQRQRRKVSKIDLKHKRHHLKKLQDWCDKKRSQFKNRREKSN